MDRMSLTSFLFQSVPESVIILFFGLMITGNVIKIKRVLIIGVLSAASSVAVRQLPIKYGIHTLIGVFIITILLFLIYDLDIKRSLFITLIGILFLLSTEIIITPIVLWIFGLKVQDVVHNDFLRVLIPIPELVVMSCITLYLYKYKSKKTITSSE